MRRRKKIIQPPPVGGEVCTYTSICNIVKRSKSATRILNNQTKQHLNMHMDHNIWRELHSLKHSCFAMCGGGDQNILCGSNDVDVRQYDIYDNNIIYSGPPSFLRVSFSTCILNVHPSIPAQIHSKPIPNIPNIIPKSNPNAPQNIFR